MGIPLPHLGSRSPFASTIPGREKLKKAGLARPVLQLRSSASDHGSKNKAFNVETAVQVVEMAETQCKRQTEEIRFRKGECLTG